MDAHLVGQFCATSITDVGRFGVRLQASLLSTRELQDIFLLTILRCANTLIWLSLRVVASSAMAQL